MAAPFVVSVLEQPEFLTFPQLGDVHHRLPQYPTTPDPDFHRPRNGLAGRISTCQPQGRARAEGGGLGAPLGK
jgi:hypothetical protein